MQRSEERLSRRVRLQRDRSGVHLLIVSQGNWFVVAFLALWTVGWGLNVLVAFDPPTGSGLLTWFVLVVSHLVLWLGPCAPVVHQILWRVAGFERVSISADLLTVERRMPLHIRWRAYPVDEISNLAAEHHRRTPRKLPTLGAFFGPFLDWFDPGSVQFDHGSDVVGFGVWLRPKEAEEIARRLRAALQAE